jgi:polar amino acid transport system substrate-binding protein/arginine/ornithine transport system substrate-binding protein
MRTLLSAAFALVVMAVPGLAQTLRVGVEGNYPPFSMISPDGKLSGFDIDIANALCAEMKVTCTLVQQEWDGMIPALNAKKFDIIVASMTITEERKKSVEFTNPYYDVPSRWVARKGAFTEATPASLKGKKIIVLRNSPRAKHVQDNFKESEILLVAKETDVYLELAAGRGDIALGSSVVSGEALLNKPHGRDYQQVGQPISIGAGAGVGIALRKGEDDLRSRLNAALATIRANGTYQRLADKYFDFPIAPQS